MKISSLMPASGKDLIKASRKEFISKVGIDIIRSVVIRILCGENVRDLTEGITKRRLHLINGAMLVLYLRGYTKYKNFIDNLPSNVIAELKGGARGYDKSVLQFLAGLTGKGFQNILRGDESNIKKYLNTYNENLKKAVSECHMDYGEIEGFIKLRKYKASVDWPFLLNLFSSIGSQTLSIRGSEKSLYGKVFERLVLGSLLSILGFRYIHESEATGKSKIFWLSSRGAKRESDATLLYRLGKGVRFDIGFIGPGNTEISLDKVSRFERELEKGEHKHYMATFIIVDRIGSRSRIQELASSIGGTIVQMSLAYWPRLIAEKLNEVLGYKHKILELDGKKIGSFIKRKVNSLDLESFL